MHIFLQPHFNNQYNKTFTFNANPKSVVTRVTEAQLKRNNRNNEILKLISEGLPKAEIARRFNITVETVRSIIKKIAPNIPKETLVKEIIESAKQGLTIEKIARTKGLSTVTVGRIIREAGLKPITDFQENKKKEEAKIRELLLQGLTPKEIAETLQTSLGRIKIVAAAPEKPREQFKKMLFDRIVEKIKSGLSCEQIAEEENLKIDSVKYIRKKASSQGIIDEPVSKHKKSVDRIVKLAQQGMVIEEIAEAEKLSTESVIRALNEANISALTSSQKKRYERNEKILEMLLDEIPRKQISEELNVNIWIINKVAEAHNAYRTIQAEKIKRINEKLKLGYSVKEVAEQENINPATVFRNAEKGNLGQTISEVKERNELIAKDIKNGLPLTEIAEKYCISIGSVRKIKSSLGLTKVYDYYDNPLGFRFDEMLDASRDITSLRQTYCRFKKGERTPEILDTILDIANSFIDKIEEFKSRFK